MKRKIIFSSFFSLILIFNSLTFSNENVRPAINVTYVVCEGFIIQAEDKKIMIDALPARRFLKRQGVEQELIRDMEEAKAPFDNVDIIFVTHRHLDHFDPDLTVQYMETNQNAVLVCPEQVHNIIKLLGGFQRVDDRIYPVKYTPGRPTTLNIKDIQIRALSMPHGPYYMKDEKTGEKVNYHADVQQSGYFINLKGRHILHTADNDILRSEDFKAYRLADEQIDVAFLEALFWGEENFQARHDLVHNLINPKQIVLMHLALGDDLSNISEEIKNAYPNLTFFQKPLETKIFK